MNASYNNVCDLSIIVPVYNTPAVLLERCISSILENVKSVESVEVLLINDGSTKSYVQEILERTAHENCCVKTIFKENTGVSDTRNIGIELSKGKFVAFVDADDFFEQNAVRYMLDVAKEVNCDLVIFGYVNEGSIPNNSPLKKRITPAEKQNLLSWLIAENTYLFRYNICLQTVWARLYNRDLLIQKKIQFPKGITLSEDMCFNLRFFKDAKDIYIDNTIVYNYGINDESAIRRFTDEYANVERNYLPIIESFIEENYSKDKKLIKSFRLRVLGYIRALRGMYFVHPQNPKSFAELKKEMNIFLSNPLIKRWVEKLRLSDAEDAIELKNILLLKCRLYWIFLLTERRRNMA